MTGGDASGRGAVVIAAGGTGGHMFPAQALAETLRERGYRIVLVTDARGERYAAEFPCDDKRMVEAATFSGGGLAAKPAAALAILRGVAESVQLFRRIKPVAVIGFGGYPSLPAMAAAVLRRTPSAIHEQNAILGRVNRALAPFVTKIAAGFPNMGRLPSGAAEKLVFIGNPVRAGVRAKASAPYAAPEMGAPVRLLIFGGSQGARILSQAVPAALADLPEPARGLLRIVQQCRDEDIEAVWAAYEAAGIEAELAPFFKDMPERLEKAHLVISRAGASTVSELAVIGRPSVLVPFAAAMDDHQTANAGALEGAGACVRVSEAEATPGRLREEIVRLLQAPERLGEMATTAGAVGRADAAAALADLVASIAGDARAPQQTGAAA